MDYQLIRQRKDAFRSYQALRRPRVLTSDGEVIAGAYRRDDVPADAIAHLLALGRRLDVMVDISRYGSGKLTMALAA